MMTQEFESWPIWLLLASTVSLASDLVTLGALDSEMRLSVHLQIVCSETALLNPPVSYFAQLCERSIPRISSLAIDIDPDANIEAAMCPVPNFNNTTCVRRPEAKMMGHD
jgi:hypothetical protein